MRLVVPVSAGELIDKITILEIKLERILDEGKLGNVRRELVTLQTLFDKCMSESYRSAVRVPLSKLRATNQLLWDLEDAIRRFECLQNFGPEFVETARSIYRENDLRAALKREINMTLHSEFVEEKSYAV